MVPFKAFKEYVTPEQYANAKMHWEKLIAGNISGAFTMDDYIITDNNKYYIITDNNKCKTAGCSAGYLPETLGIKYSYLSISNYIACCEQLIKSGLGIKYSEIWSWCFNMAWAKIDNTAKGAGIRMRILYEIGLPDNWQEQMLGCDPIQYADELNSLIK